MDRKEYLNEKKFRLQCELNKISNNGNDLIKRKIINSQINEIDFELNKKNNDNDLNISRMKDNAKSIMDFIRANRK